MGDQVRDRPCASCSSGSTVFSKVGFGWPSSEATAARLLSRRLRMVGSTSAARMRSKAGSCVPLTVAVLMSFHSQCGEHGLRIGTDPAPQREGFGGLFDQHAPAFMGTGATLF